MMDIPKLKPFQPILIEWIDAHSEDGWIEKNIYDEIRKRQNLVVYTLGFYLDNDNTFLRICFGRAEWDHVPKSVINVFAIPLVNIKKITQLEI